MFPVTKDIYRGARPKDALFLVMHRGIKTVLSLQSGWFEFLYNDDYERDNRGLRIFKLLCSNFRPPSNRQVQDALEILTNEKYYPIYVHCKHGKDRTGYIIACYRVMVCDWSVDDAIAEWRKYGFHEWFYFWWIWVFKSRMRKYDLSR